MANVNFPHGLRPLGVSLSGGAPVFEEFSKAVGYGTAIFVYDAVNRVADGTIEASATPGTTLYSGVSMNYGALSTATTHTVCISPDAIYEAQANDGTGFAEADMGLNANLVLTAGNTTTKMSKHQINVTGADVTNTLDVHLLKLLNVPDNAAGGYARVEIMFNKHRMAPGVVGV
jgi:hypothetical protein